MDINAITGTLSHKEDGMVLDHNPNREAQIDTDGIFYAIAKPHKTRFETDMKACINHAEWLVHASGSGWGALHSTQALKGGREQMAWHHPYQAKRHGYQDEVYMDRVRQLRTAFQSVQTPVLLPLPQYYVEADDSMTQRQHDRIAQTGDYNSSIIITSDKDLGISMGAVMGARDHKVTNCGVWDGTSWSKTWGWCAYSRLNAAKKSKLNGRGMAFFWAQMLAGDKADTIKGIHSIPRHLIELLKPRKRGSKGGAPTKLCGESLAAELISACGNEKRAYKFVLQCYKDYYKEWGEFFFFEMAFLLWMRRTTAPTDCLYYLNSLGFDYQLHPQQVSAINKYLELCGEWQGRLSNAHSNMGRPV